MSKPSAFNTAAGGIPARIEQAVDCTDFHGESPQCFNNVIKTGVKVAFLAENSAYPGPFQSPNFLPIAPVFCADSVGFSILQTLSREISSSFGTSSQGGEQAATWMDMVIIATSQKFFLLGRSARVLKAKAIVQTSSLRRTPNGHMDGTTCELFAMPGRAGNALLGKQPVALCDTYRKNLSYFSEITSAKEFFVAHQPIRPDGAFSKILLCFDQNFAGQSRNNVSECANNSMNMGVQASGFPVKVDANSGFMMEVRCSELRISEKVLLNKVAQPSNKLTIRGMTFTGKLGAFSCRSSKKILKYALGEPAKDNSFWSSGSSASVSNDTSERTKFCRKAGKFAHKSTTAGSTFTGKVACCNRQKGQGRGAAQQNLCQHTGTKRVMSARFVAADSANSAKRSVQNGVTVWALGDESDCGFPVKVSHSIALFEVSMALFKASFPVKLAYFQAGFWYSGTPNAASFTGKPTLNKPRNIPQISLLASTFTGKLGGPNGQKHLGRHQFHGETGLISFPCSNDFDDSRKRNCAKESQQKRLSCTKGLRNSNLFMYLQKQNNHNVGR